MADLVGVFGVPHTPLFWRDLQADDLGPFQVIKDGYDRFRDHLDALNPDVIVMVASDHFRATTTANLPAFLIGKAPRIPATFSNEVRAFGMPQFEVEGSPEIARALLGDGPNMTSEFDFGFSDEIRLDHAFSLPLLYLRPQHDLPVVPVFTNATAPPMPVAQRFIDLGHYLRRAISDAPGGRVAIITSAHMAFELGGPRQFSGGSPDPEFDRLGERWLVERDLQSAAAHATFDRMLAAGNVTHQYMNLLAACAAAADLPLAHGKATMCPHGNEPFFSWGAT